MIRPSDKGPGRNRPPRIKQARSSGGTPPAGGDGSTSSGCWPWTFAPPLGLLLFAISLLAVGVTR